MPCCYAVLPGLPLCWLAPLLRLGWWLSSMLKDLPPSLPHVFRQQAKTKFYAPLLLYGEGGKAGRQLISLRAVFLVCGCGCGCGCVCGCCVWVLGCREEGNGACQRVKEARSIYGVPKWLHQTNACAHTPHTYVDMHGLRSTVQKRQRTSRMATHKSASDECCHFCRTCRCSSTASILWSRMLCTSLRRCTLQSRFLSASTRQTSTSMLVHVFAMVHLWLHACHSCACHLMLLLTMSQPVFLWCTCSSLRCLANANTPVLRLAATCARFASCLVIQTVFLALGRALTILITLDKIIDGNEVLAEHWTLYKRYVYICFVVQA